MTLVGSIINIPPVIFGSSIAWWTLASATAAFIVVALWSRFSNSELKVKAALTQAFDVQGLIAAALIFIALYLLATFVSTYMVINFGIIVPFFRALIPTTRIPVFFMFIPFFFVYFMVEGLYLHELRQPSWRKSALLTAIVDLAKTIGIKITPFLAVLLLQYIPFVLLGFQLFPSFAGFLIEFLWLLIPIFIISTACSWWLYHSTTRIGPGAVFNALVFAWIAASLFPF